MKVSRPGSRLKADTDKRMKRSPLRKRSSAAKRARDFAFEFGSEARVLWFQDQPCWFTGGLPSVNMHLKGRRRFGYRVIIPALQEVHDFAHQHGIHTTLTKYGRTMEQALDAAVDYENRWQAEQGDRG